VAAIEADGGLADADPGRILGAVAQATRAAAAAWEAEQPVPPTLLWHLTLDRAEALVGNALRHPFECYADQRCFPEVPFGEEEQAAPQRILPWDPRAPVSVPGTKIRIRGRIDRLDLSGTGDATRVVDYKTSRQPKDFVLRGGRELQRCLYAFATSALLGGVESIDAGLLYPSHVPGQFDRNIYMPLLDPGRTMNVLSSALAEACRNLADGLAVPGVAAGLRAADTRNLKDDNRQHEEDPMGFALPVVPGTMLEPKKAAAAALLGGIPQFWEEP